jgi:hypothetical protein
MSLGYRCRSKNTWHLSGATLAEAIAKEVDSSSDRASMNITDLIIDLLAPEDEGAVSLYRVLD